MPDAPLPGEIQKLADLYSLAGDPTRLRLLAALLEGEKCVCSLSEVAGTSMSAASHQLRLLKAGGLVKPRRDGRHIYYSLADEHVLILLEIGLEHIRE